MTDVKWSDNTAFPPVSGLANGDQLVGLRSGANNKFNMTIPLPVAQGGSGQSTYTDGQLLIGNSTGNTLAKATLTPGTGISITNGSGTITIANTGELLPTLQNAYDNGTGAIAVATGKPLTLTSTTAGFLMPSMTTAQFDAISSPPNGEMAWTTDDNRIIINRGTSMSPTVDEVAYISDIDALTQSIIYGEMYFTGNATATTISMSSTPVKVNATYSSGDLQDFKQASGTLTYTATETREMLVVVSADSIVGTAADSITFFVAKGGSVIAKSEVTLALDSTASRALTAKCLVNLVTNDTLEFWVQNNTAAHNVTVGDMNFTATAIGGGATDEITLAGEDYLSLAGQVITANPVNLSGTNVTGLLPLSNIQNITTARLLGRTTAGSGVIEQITVLGGLNLVTGNLSSKVVAGNAFPTIAPDTNVSASALDGQLFYMTNMSESGGIVTMTVNFTFTATNFDCAVRVPYPSIPGGTSVSFVNVVGNISNATIPTTADGIVLGGTPAASYFTVNMHVVSATDYKGRITAQYQVV